MLVSAFQLALTLGASVLARRGHGHAHTAVTAEPPQPPATTTAAPPVDITTATTATTATTTSRVTAGVVVQPAATAAGTISSTTVMTSATTASPAARTAPLRCSDPPDEAVLAEARRYYEMGFSLLQARGWIDAERAFRTAIGLYDGPNTHLLLAQALVGEERFADAYNEYDSTVGLAAVCAQVPGAQNRYTPTVSRSVAERDQLKDKVALLTIRAGDNAPAAFEVRLGEHLLTTGEFGRPRAVAGDSVMIRASADGFMPFEQQVALHPGTMESVSVVWNLAVVHDVAPPPTPQFREVRTVSVARPVGVAIATVGSLALGVGISMYFAGKGQFASLEASCGMTGCAPASVNMGEAIETAGIGLFWGGIGLSTVGAIISGAAQTRVERVPLTAWVAPGMVGVAGTF